MVVVVLVSLPTRDIKYVELTNRFGTSHHVVLEIEQYQESFFVPPRPKAIAAIGRLIKYYTYYKSMNIFYKHIITSHGR